MWIFICCVLLAVSTWVILTPIYNFLNYDVSARHVQDWALVDIYFPSSRIGKITIENLRLKWRDHWTDIVTKPHLLQEQGVHVIKYNPKDVKGVPLTPKVRPNKGKSILLAYPLDSLMIESLQNGESMILKIEHSLEYIFGIRITNEKIVTIKC